MVGPNNITSDGGTNDFGSNDCKSLIIEHA